MADVVDRYVIEVDSSGAVRSLKNLEEAQRGTTEASVEQGQSFEKGAKSAINYAAKLAIAYEAAKVLANAGMATLKAAAESEQAQLRLNRALAVTGQTSDALSAALTKQANSLRDTTGISDEAISAAQTLAIQYGATGGEIEKLTRASVAFAEAMGTDVNSAMMEMIRLQEGVVSRTMRLIPGMLELTEAELAAGKGVELINAQFGQFIGSGTEGAAGAVRLVATAFDELSEAIGRSVLESGWLQRALLGLRAGLAASRDMDLGVLGTLSTTVLATGAAAASESEAAKMANRLRGFAPFNMAADAQRGMGSPMVMRPAGSGGRGGGTPSGGGRGGTADAGFSIDFEGSGKDWIQAQEDRDELLLDLERRTGDGLTDIAQSNWDRRLEIENWAYSERERMAAESGAAIAMENQIWQDQFVQGAQTVSRIGIDALVRLAAGAKVSGKEIAAAMISSIGQQMVSQGIFHFWTGVAGSVWPGAGNPALMGIGLKEIALGTGMSLVGAKINPGAVGGGVGGSAGAARGGGAFMGGVSGGDASASTGGRGERRITVIVEGWMNPEEAGHRTKKAIEEANRVGI